MVSEYILKMKSCVSSMPEVVSTISLWVKDHVGRYVCVANVHVCMEVFDDNDYEKIVNKADIVVADGKPIVWAQRLLGHRDARQVRGEDLVLHLCAQAEREGMVIGFYGATQPVLDKLKNQLMRRFPNLQIGCIIAPPFRQPTDKEEAEYLSEIARAKIDILFVGLGCPKQERWMAEHQNQVSCIMLGVGAAFDFISGNKVNAPRWIRHIGLEWLFRLLSEPGRLWKRYLKHNPRFLVYFLGQLAGKRFR